MTGDWQNRGGQTQASAPLLPPMDLNIVHQFELVSIDFQDGVTETYKGVSKIVNKCKMVWKEAGKEKDFHRVWVNVNEFYSEKSNMMKFLMAASGKPFVAGVTVKIGDYLGEHHRIKARVKARINKETGEPNGYYDFVPESIKPAVDPQLASSKPDASLANALLLAKGASDFNTAMSLLKSARASKEVTMALFQANLDGKVTFPI